jgi:hypothetical protein
MTVKIMESDCAAMTDEALSMEYFGAGVVLEREEVVLLAWGAMVVAGTAS